MNEEEAGCKEKLYQSYIRMCHISINMVGEVKLTDWKEEGKQEKTSMYECIILRIHPKKATCVILASAVIHILCDNSEL
jgi:hypothetical protein